MLAIPDSERRYESSCNVRSGDDESSYGQRNERVSCVFGSLYFLIYAQSSHHSAIILSTAASVIIDKARLKSQLRS